MLPIKKWLKHIAVHWSLRRAQLQGSTTSIAEGRLRGSLAAEARCGGVPRSATLVER